MKKYFSLTYLRRIVRWVWQGKFHLLTFAAVIVTIFYITGRLNFYPAIVSALLSITGLLIILTQQILDARQFANHQPNTVTNWIKSFPTGKPIAATLNGVLGLSSTLKARAILSVQSDATVEQKIDFLLRQVKSIQENVANIDDRIDEVASSLTNKSREIETELNMIGESLKEIIAGHIVGTYDINLFGVMITICGTLIQLFSA